MPKKVTAAKAKKLKLDDLGKGKDKYIADDGLFDAVTRLTPDWDGTNGILVKRLLMRLPHLDREEIDKMTLFEARMDLCTGRDRIELEIVGDICGFKHPFSSLLDHSHPALIDDLYLALLDVRRCRRTPLVNERLMTIVHHLYTMMGDSDGRTVPVTDFFRKIVNNHIVLAEMIVPDDIFGESKSLIDPEAQLMSDGLFFAVWMIDPDATRDVAIAIRYLRLLTYSERDIESFDQADAQIAISLNKRVLRRLVQPPPCTIWEAWDEILPSWIRRIDSED